MSALRNLRARGEGKRAGISRLPGLLNFAETRSLRLGSQRRQPLRIKPFYILGAWNMNFGVRELFLEILLLPPLPLTSAFLGSGYF